MLVRKVQQAARCCHENVTAATDQRRLMAERSTAINHTALYERAKRELARFVVDLKAQSLLMKRHPNCFIYYYIPVLPARVWASRWPHAVCPRPWAVRRATASARWAPETRPSFPIPFARIPWDPVRWGWSGWRVAGSASDWCNRICECSRWAASTVRRQQTSVAVPLDCCRLHSLGCGRTCRNWRPMRFPGQRCRPRRLMVWRECTMVWDWRLDCRWILLAAGTLY